MTKKPNIGDTVTDPDLYEQVPNTKGKVLSVNPVIVKYWDRKVKYKPSDLKYLKIVKP